ncbi:unnamed protein product [Oikopleura dioica]|uniref:L-type lectin-like domain-containing protein n=1 Tax=Oikopleura dioica TaxID=34765 RepID=E4YL41_OIKDI|nr:unnamed protein product [Oikopleura dioica]
MELFLSGHIMATHLLATTTSVLFLLFEAVKVLCGQKRLLKKIGGKSKSLSVFLDEARSVLTEWESGTLSKMARCLTQRRMFTVQKINGWVLVFSLILSITMETTIIQKIMAFVNDGTNSYDHANDGGSTALFSCRRDFRNKPYPVRLKVRYYKSTLTIFYHAGITEFEDYEYCGSADNVVLEKGFFGMSAATGGLSDDHDVMKFLTHSITDPESNEAQPDDEEQEEIQKLEEEMKVKVEELNTKFTEDKSKFAEEHPDIVPQDTLDIGSDDPQLQLIFTVQNHIQQNIKTIAADIASVKEMIDMLPAKISVPQAQDALQDKQDIPAPGIPVESSRETIDAIRGVDGKTTKMTNDLAVLRNELSVIANAVASLKSQPEPATGNPAQDIEDAKFKKSQQDLMNNLRQDIQTMTLKIGNIERQKSQCPKIPEVSCVSSTTFVFLTALQIGVIAFLIHYKMNQEAQAKKFF